MGLSQCAMLLMMWDSAILQRCVPLLPRSCCSGVRYEWFHAVRCHTAVRTACLKLCWGWGRLCAPTFAGRCYGLYLVRVLLGGFLATISQGELHQTPVIECAAMSCNARNAAKGKRNAPLAQMLQIQLVRAVEVLTLCGSLCAHFTCISRAMSMQLRWMCHFCTGLSCSAPWGRSAAHCQERCCGW